MIGLKGGELTASDFKALELRWIDEDTARRQLLRRVDSAEGAELMGCNGYGSYEGMLIPYVWPSEDRVREFRLRRDHPEYENGKPKKKYVSPPGRGNMLYFAVGTDPAWLRDQTLPLIITEGEFKTIALNRLAHDGLGDAAERPRFLAAGISGVWNWKGTIGKTVDASGTRVDEKGPIPDLSRLAWEGRKVTIIFDRDAEKNESVYWARRKLAEELKGRKATVRVFEWPAEDEHAKGIDDLLAVQGPERVFGLIERSFSKETSGNENGYSDGPSWPKTLSDEAYYGLAGDIVRAIEPHVEADPAALLTQFLIGFGNMVGRTASCRVAADEHYTNLNVVLVGPTAKGRKGQSWNAVKQPLSAAGPEWAKKCITSGLSSGEGLISCVRDPIEKEEPIRDRDKKVTSYQKVVVDAGVSDKRLMVVEPEFARVLQVAQREGSTISTQIRQAWDSGDLRTLTKSQMTATGAHISIIGHITQDELLRDLTRTESANGFANRFLWICVKRSKYLPEGGKLSGVDFAPLIRRLTNAVEFLQQAGKLSRDEEAKELWAEVYPQLSGDRLGMFGAVTGRAEAITLRLSLIYALLDRSTVIGVHHLRAALEVWRYAEESCRFIFGDKLGDQMADTILTALRNAPEGLTRTDINQKLFDRNKTAEQITRALNVLKSHGLADFVKKDGAGRPTELWQARAA